MPLAAQFEGNSGRGIGSIAQNLYVIVLVLFAVAVAEALSIVFESDESTYDYPQGRDF